jgi:hypothetical protein
VNDQLFDQTPLRTKYVGKSLGQASALKLCYASLAKGFTALAMQSLGTASRHGVLDDLLIELEASQPVFLRKATNGIPAALPKAHRWVREMEEIAAAHGETGFDPACFQGIAQIYAKVKDLHTDNNIRAIAEELGKLNT